VESAGVVNLVHVNAMIAVVEAEAVAAAPDLHD
jgi:hypothetical protein